MDLARVFRYSTKMPVEGYDKNEDAGDLSGGNGNSGSVTQSHTDLRPIHHYRLFRFMRKHKLFDAWLAGGDGSEFLRETKKASLRAAYASLRMEVPVTGLAWVDGWD